MAHATKNTRANSFNENSFRVYKPRSRSQSIDLFRVLKPKPEKFDGFPKKKNTKLIFLTFVSTVLALFGFVLFFSIMGFFLLPLSYT